MKIKNLNWKTGCHFSWGSPKNILRHLYLKWTYIKMQSWNILFNRNLSNSEKVVEFTHHPPPTPKKEIKIYQCFFSLFINLMPKKSVQIWPIFLFLFCCYLDIYWTFFLNLFVNLFESKNCFQREAYWELIMGTEKPDNLEDALEAQRKISSVSYNVYDTITSTTSDSSNAYFVYDTISSTAVRIPYISTKIWHVWNCCY